MLRSYRRSITITLIMFFCFAYSTANAANVSEVKKRFDKAVSYQKAGKLKEALVEYQAAKKLDPKNVAVLSNMGLVYAGLNQLSNAESAFQQALWVDPKNEFATEHMARVLLANGKKNEALTYARKFLGLKPKDFTARFLFAMVNLELDKMDAAIDAFRSALHVKPTDRTALYNLAVCYLQTNKYGDALETAEKLTKAEPDNGYFHLVAADAAEKMGDKETAIRHYEAASKSNESSVNALLNLSRLYAASDEAKSTEMLRKILAKDKGNFVANMSLGRVYYKDGNMKEAEPYFAAAMKTNPKDPDAVISLALIQAQLGKKEEGLKNAKSGLELDPKSRVAMEVLGYIQEISDNEEDALSIYRKWEIAYPKDPLPNRKMANIYSRQSKDDAMVKHFDIAVSKDPKNADTIKDYASALVGAKLYDKAYQQYSRVIELKPKDVEMIVQAANTLQWQNKNDEAIEMYRKAIAADPKDMMPRSALANFYNKLKKPDQALEEYNKVLELDPKNTPALQAIAMIYDEKKDYEKVIDAYRKLYEIDPDNAAYAGRIPATYEKIGKIDLAVAESRKLVESEPDDRSYRSMLAYYLDKSEDYDGAIAEYMELVKNGDDFEKSDSYSKIAACQEKQKRLDEAVVSYKNALEIRPDNLIALDGIAKVLNDQGKQEELQAYYMSLIVTGKPDVPYRYYYETMKKAGKIQDAVSTLEELSGKNQDNVQLTITLARAYVDIDAKDRAVEVYKRVLVSRPDDPWVNKELGPLYESMGRNDDAIASYEAAAKIFTFDIDILLKLGALYEKLGRNADALDTYRKYIKADPANTAIKEKVRKLETGKPESLETPSEQTPVEAGGKG